MSELLKQQQRFAVQIARLILAADARGYGVTLGDAYRDPRCPYGHPRSLHKQRLAVDLNLFLDGEYITDAQGHRELHELWETMGGSPMIEDDANHYSFPRGDMT